MKLQYPLAVALILVSGAWKPLSEEWIPEKKQGYTLHYLTSDKNDLVEYTGYFEQGIREVNTFFGSGFKKEFDVYVHPNRSSLERQWQKDWNMPDFKSECWMVASGVALKLDIIAPKKWSSDACEHVYTEKVKTQRLITHELAHVFHGQLNASPDFSNTENIDWFVEGLATYASGQCDSLRMAEVKKAVQENKTPSTLDKFWSGKLKYGLSGSVILYIDKTFGRAKLIELLPFSKKKEILNTLGLTETDLLNGWKKYVNNS